MGRSPFPRARRGLAGRPAPARCGPPSSSPAAAHPERRDVATGRAAETRWRGRSRGMGGSFRRRVSSASEGRLRAAVARAASRSNRGDARRPARSAFVERLHRSLPGSAGQRTRSLPHAWPRQAPIQRPPPVHRPRAGHQRTVQARAVGRIATPRTRQQTRPARSPGRRPLAVRQAPEPIPSNPPAPRIPHLPTWCSLVPTRLPGSPRRVHTPHASLRSSARFKVEVHVGTESLTLRAARADS